MNDERVPRMPAKSMLSWRICRLRLDAVGARWLATGSKGNRVAVIELPQLLSADAAADAEWIREIEARFERYAFDPCADEPPRSQVDAETEPTAWLDR